MFWLRHVKYQYIPPDHLKSVFFEDKNDEKNFSRGRNKKIFYVEVDIGILFFQKNLGCPKNIFSTLLKGKSAKSGQGLVFLVQN